MLNWNSNGYLYPVDNSRLALVGQIKFFKLKDKPENRPSVYWVKYSNYTLIIFSNSNLNKSRNIPRSMETLQTSWIRFTVFDIWVSTSEVKEGWSTGWWSWHRLLFALISFRNWFQCPGSTHCFLNGFPRPEKK